MLDTTKTARRITITGVVQGVGFRPFVYNLAAEMGLDGWVLNHSGGVDIEVEGDPVTVEAFIEALEDRAPPLAQVESLAAEEIAPPGFDGFEIRHSKSQAGRYQLISPDVATCPDCLRELLDPADRRYRYPFINCTNCGPRFTIIEDIPYDRPKTTMRVFPMCEACRAEYEDPRDRRFHAQPNACPVCGPQIWLVEAPGSDPAGLEAAPPSPFPPSDGVFARAKELLLAGKILAIKGLGGFHLACDATNAGAVRTLRARKRRPYKPFALMVPTLDDVRALCEVPAEAEALLTSPQSPIVLMDARAEVPVVEEVAPHTQTLGVMVPYTPLHHVLLRDVGRPLVMTSGNVTEEPIVKDNDEALRRLAPLADAFLLHNRDIHARYDDSVVQVFRVESQKSKVKSQASRAANPTSNVASQTLPVTHHSLPHHVSRFTFHTQLVRRARGYAPFPIRLPFDAPQVYAAGPLLKNTFTLARDTYAFVSQHIGDLENLETLEHYEAALATYRHLFRLEPELVACDLHPDYMSTRLAGTYAHEHGLPAPYPVQHHKAHIASVLADHGWGPDDGPVIGVALDGTGYGEDRRIWGGEWFVGDYRGFERVAHLAYLPLPGGDAAIRHPWRTAVAYLHALDLDEDLTLGAFCPGDVMRVRTMVDRELNTPQTSSMGRLFDAVSALLDVCHEATYEAQAAIELEQVASTALSGGHVHADAYPVEITKSDAGDGAAPYQIEPAPLLDALLLDRARGVATAEIALRFHATVAAMVVRVADRLRAETGIETVAISGGVFQNRLLLSLALPLLARAGFEVLRHHQVPPNDGCVSLGQAAMAAVSVT